MPMKIGDANFHERVETNLHNMFMRGAVAGAQERLHTRRLEAAEELGNWEEWRSLGEEIRQHTLENLDYYLMQLSENVAKRGGHVFFAQTAEEANNYIRNVVIQKNAKKIVKSKSMVTEEINLNAVLEAAGCEVIETDLGEYICKWTITILLLTSSLQHFIKIKNKFVTSFAKNSATSKQKNRKSLRFMPAKCSVMNT